MTKFNRILLFLMVIVFSSVTLATKANSVAALEQNSSYNIEISTKLVNRCDFIKDYLSQTVRINELAARQNKVRGWEFILRKLAEVQASYAKFNIGYAELAGNINSLKLQLEQFKVDFETYDEEFQKLLSIDCRTRPEPFWLQLEKLRSFRSGIALASENYKASLNSVLKNEELKW